MKSFFSFLGFALFACGCDNSNGILVSSFDLTSSGDPLTHASLDISQDGFLQITTGPILKLDRLGPYSEEDISKISAKATLQTSLNPERSCEVFVQSGKGQASKVDLAFLLNTTETMGPSVEGIANTFGSFASALQNAGLDVRYAVVTFGDSFHTKETSSSSFSLGTGARTPPLFDLFERPLLDFTDSMSIQGFLSEVNAYIGPGKGGGDSIDNDYGVAVAMAGKMENQPGLTRRSNALFYEILVGDDCSYTQEVHEEPDLIENPWIPPSKTQLANLLGDGKVMVHAIRNKTWDVCSEETPDLMPLVDLANATGGESFDLPQDKKIDLQTLGLATYITNFWMFTIDPSCFEGSKDFILTLEITVWDTSSLSRKQTLVFTVQLS